MGAPLDKTDLLHGLRSLGVSRSDILFIHSSFKSIGPVDGGAATVVCALEDAVGPGGTVLMPSFNLDGKDMQARAECWDIDATPSSVGWLTEFFRRMSGTVRSDHYSHSVAARGHDAEWFVNGHRHRTGMSSPWDLEPWGHTYGTDSPMMRAMERPCSKILMLGVDYESSTYQHVVEVMDWHRRLADDPDAVFYYYKPRERLGRYWESVGDIQHGPVGTAACRLFGLKAYVDALRAEVARSPETYCRWHPRNFERSAADDEV